MHYDSPLNQPFEPGEFPQGHATFSLRYHLANVLLRKSIRLEHLTEDFICDPEVAALARKVNVAGTISPDKIEAAGVSVRMKDGREFTAYEDVAKGNALKKPLSKEEIEDKFKANVAFSRTISRENAEKALDMLRNVDKMDDVTRLVELLAV
jgi:2-methylcitrate dehydratase PrpD